MKLVVTGGTAEKRALARKAALWALENELKINRDIRINLRFKDTKLEWYGEAYHVAPSSYRSKSFTVVVANEIDVVEEKELFLETVMHEIVHVWQMANNTARYALDSNGVHYKSYWKGKDESKTPYSRQPWERQAFRKEKTLTRKFIASLA